MMFRAASLLALVAYVAAQAADPSINTPAAVVQCQPAQISYVATNSPVFISIIPGGQPSAAPLQDLGQQNASPFTWRATIPAGTSITFQIRDSTGAVAYSAPITIQSSNDASCLGAGATTTPATSAPATSAASSSAAGSASSAIASVSSAASSAVSSVSASVSSVVASATSRATATSPASSTRAATATSAIPSASAPANNAAVPNAKVGLAGLLGLAAAVVMA